MFGTSIMMTNHRAESRSKRIRGSLVKLFDAGGVMTVLKKTSVSTFITPSATPVLLLKVRIRPFTQTMNCEGPAAPMLSGGKERVSVRVAPTKLVAVVCGLSGERVVPDGNAG